MPQEKVDAEKVGKLRRKSKQRCPRCGMRDYVYRSRTRTRWERIMRTALRIRPYRCSDCNLRFYAFSLRATKRLREDSP